jgi:hypothetical protein
LVGSLISRANLSTSNQGFYLNKGKSASSTIWEELHNKKTVISSHLKILKIKQLLQKLLTEIDPENNFSRAEI